MHTLHFDPRQRLLVGLVALVVTLVLVMVAAGHSSLAWMVPLTALVIGEELTVRGRRFTRPAAVVLAVAAAAVALSA